MSSFLSHKSLIIALILTALLPASAWAATLSVSPNTGVYTAGSSFTVRVVVNTQGKSINAAEGSLKFNPQEVTVVSVDRSNSIFNLWVTEPTFSNSAGTITFSGGMPTGYTGTSGTIFNVTFRSTSASTARVAITDGSVLANDGKGTNVLSSMNGGTFTIQALSTSPAPEVVEYVAPVNTPAAPQINSVTHSDQQAWYKTNEAVLRWNLPAGVTQVRTLIDNKSTSIPTKVYEDPISEIRLSDLPQGVSYFHLQFRNADGWGRVGHYRLAIDSEKPETFVITQAAENDYSNPAQVLQLESQDKTSLVKRYQIKIDNQDPYEFIDEESTGKVTLPKLDPGYHAIIIEAFDQAGNSVIATYSFTITAFAQPTFTDYPTELNDGVIPVIRGLTKPGAEVTVVLQMIGADPVNYTLNADSEGVFSFIPSSSLIKGVYELTAFARDEYGAQSLPSEKIRIAVQEPGYIQIGTFIVSILSILIPLVAMVILLVIGTIFMITYWRRFRSNVSRESGETLAVLTKEFAALSQLVNTGREKLMQAKKSKKLNQTEMDIFKDMEVALKQSEAKIKKEATDVKSLSSKN
ncbi:MAG TPA: cohesin domain-containing protein [Candidatus Paceibacterota bacterium]|nr:cohesin domain-containing protein [Candidatus Paceibacterota bacterium]